MAQERMGSPSICTVQAPQAAMPQPNFRAGEFQVFTQNPQQRRVGRDTDLVPLSVDGEGDHGASPLVFGVVRDSPDEPRTGVDFCAFVAFQQDH
jgi:hypothetical protein